MLKKTTARVSSFKAYVKNPLIDMDLFNKNFSSKHKKIGYDKKSVIADSDTGEIRGNVVAVTGYNFDRGLFVKVFIGKAPFLNLSRGGKALFLYIISIMRENVDTVFFNYDEAMLSLEYSSKESVYCSVAELLEKKFIAKTMYSNVFFINPSIFFRGDRAKYYDKLKKEKENEQ